MAARLDGFAPGSGAGAGYRDSRTCSQRLHDISERFFFWKPVEDSARHVRPARSLNASDAGATC